ncbi:MAG: transglutaminase family protein [Methyloligellaceae bacterium]
MNTELPAKPTFETELEPQTETVSEPEEEIKTISPRQTLITDQTWASICNIAEEIMEKTAEALPTMSIGSELTFFSMVDLDLSSEDKQERLRDHAQELMQRLKEKFAPNSRIQVKKRLGTYKLEWKVKSRGKFSYQIFLGEECLKVHPPKTDTWPELDTYISGLFDAAYETGLSADKFNGNGIPHGTGEGSKIIISGLEEEISPFLQRPDLLLSLATYWQNHPSLSYLFSGQNAGPMGPAPRADEVRNDIHYEMEIASRFIPLPGRGKMPPEIIDQMFRHILTDRSGDPGKGEIAIDQLHPVEAPERQLGLVILRCFEMVPDPRLHLLQILIVRAIMARLATDPYREKCVKWRSALQNEFMLPYFLEVDYKNVLLDLEDYGYKFQSHWFAAQVARRFPPLGTVTLDDVDLDLSLAIEPLNTHYDPHADSIIQPPQLQRLQLKTAHLDPDRHIVTCNGFIVPLTEPDENTIQVAAIRLYKNLPQLPSGAVMKRTPNKLTFELVDKETKASLGGFLFIIPTPEEYRRISMTCDPIEARHRRNASFDPFIPYGGEVFVHPSPRTPESPHVLDMRII